MVRMKYNQATSVANYVTSSGDSINNKFKKPNLDMIHNLIKVLYHGGGGIVRAF